MHLVALIVLCLAALSAFLEWYVATPRRFASLSLALCLFIIGFILTVILVGDPRVTIGR